MFQTQVPKSVFCKRVQNKCTKTTAKCVAVSSVPLSGYHETMAKYVPNLGKGKKYICLSCPKEKVCRHGNGGGNGNPARARELCVGRKGNVFTRRQSGGVMGKVCNEEAARTNKTNATKMCVCKPPKILRCAKAGKRNTGSMLQMVAAADPEKRDREERRDGHREKKEKRREMHAQHTYIRMHAYVQKLVLFCFSSCPSLTLHVFQLEEEGKVKAA